MDLQGRVAQCGRVLPWDSSGRPSSRPVWPVGGTAAARTKSQSRRMANRPIPADAVLIEAGSGSGHSPGNATSRRRNQLVARAILALVQPASRASPSISVSKEWSRLFRRSRLARRDRTLP